jgi:hypothetical protein
MAPFGFLDKIASGPPTNSNPRKSDGKLFAHKRGQLCSLKLHQEREGPADLDLSVPEAKRPHQRAARRQEPAENRCAHRLGQERAAATGNKLV